MGWKKWSRKFFQDHQEYTETVIQEFYHKIKPYYYNSKRYYLERDQTYKNLITIIKNILFNWGT